MLRRRFLNVAALAGLSVVAPLGMRALRAQPGDAGTPADVGPYGGPYYLFVNAGGGWDPTMLCDPKGGEINRSFAAGNIASAGNIRYAPVSYTKDGPAGKPVEYFSNRRFFEKHYSRLLVLNGVDMATNNHDTGTRFTWSGSFEDGAPSFAALVAAARAPSQPTAFLSSGGYDVTQGVVPLTRIDNFDTIARIGYPNRADPNNAKSLYHSDATAARIASYQRERLAALSAAQTLPAIAHAQGQLMLTRTGSNQLERMMQFAPTRDELNSAANDLTRQALGAFAAFQAGVAASANISTGGFDTHSNHDANQTRALGDLLVGLDALWVAAEQKGLADKLVVVVGSDFGRTPTYNDGNGKDHWSVTSVMMMGAGIEGNRVIGATDEGFRAVGFDAASLAVNPSSDQRLTPKSIHLALRRLAGITDSDVVKRFPIVGGQDMPLFGLGYRGLRAVPWSA